MKYFAIIFVLLFIGCSKNKTSKYSFPPEWEPHEAVWTDYATENSYPTSYNDRLKVIATLSKYVKTKVVYDNDSLKSSALGKLDSLGAKWTNVEFIKTDFPMNWVRDPGPIFATNGKQLRLIDFKWSSYGDAYPAFTEYDKPRGDADNKLALDMGIDIDSTGIYLEGGGIDVSHNTVMAYRAMADQRNPNKSLKEVEKTILKALNKKQMIWLDEFPLIDKPQHKIDNIFGNGANGHIDVSTRFLNDSTIVATVISERDKNKSILQQEDYRIYQSNLEQLKKARQPNGKPYIIVTIEAPDYSLYYYPSVIDQSYLDRQREETKEKFKAGDSIRFVPCLEYANFLITNGAVICSKTWKEGMPESEKIKDERLQTILRKYFPDRDIVPLDVLEISWGGGGIHCRTQQEPKLE
ncbi:agmatine deiminase family protein [Gaetbulibacter aestuarii]|uniref:Agmatine deiminase family protein n=1 Tax=Gaetbulibacter aestuarii TaxID=1502358 RepID=A0ABW7MYV4_9FLAO